MFSLDYAKYLFDAKPILEGWGFKHLLTMVWEKTFGRSAGMPLYGFRWNAEFILVGYKGKPDIWIKGKPLIPAVFQAENIRHSEKPAKFYDMVETLGEPRIDIFARRRRFGWDVYGNEVESDIELFEGSLIGRTIDSESMNRGSSPRPQASLGSSSGRTSGFEPEKHSSNLCPRTNNLLVLEP